MLRRKCFSAQSTVKSVKTLLHESTGQRSVFALFEFIKIVGSVFWFGFLKVFGEQIPMVSHGGQGTAVYIYAFFRVSGGPLGRHSSNTWTKEAMELFKPHNQPDSALLLSPVKPRRLETVSILEQRALLFSQAEVAQCS